MKLIYFFIILGVLGSDSQLLKTAISSIAKNNMYSYEIDFQDEQVFSHCEEYPNSQITDYIDNSQLKFTRMENGSIHAKGKFIVTNKLPRKAMATLEVYKRQRGQWIHTIYSMRRSSFCAALFSPDEFWYAYLKDVPAENRVCPFPDGTNIDIDFLMDLVITLTDKTLEGEYKLQIMIGSGTEMKCTNIFARFYRL